MNARLKIAMSVVALLGLLSAPVLAQQSGGPGRWYGGEQTNGKPLSMEQAENIARQVVERSGDTGLVPGHIMEFDNNFYVAAEFKSSGQGAFEFLINRYTGFVHPEPQSMMWNTRFGMMGGYGGGMMGGGYGGGMMGGGYGGGMMGGYGGGMGYPGTVRPGYGGQGSRPSEPAPMTLEKAQVIAQKFLDDELPGAKTDEAITFPGYYTIDVSRNGSVVGMLSVNAYSGQVWYHRWHGAFVREKDLR